MNQGRPQVSRSGGRAWQFGIGAAVVGAALLLSPSSGAAQSPVGTAAAMAASLPGQQSSPLSRDNRARHQRLDVDLEIGELMNSYRGALVRAARGDRDGALETLMDLERSSIEPGPNRTADIVWKAQAQVVRSVAARDPEALVPILVLHHDAMGRYRERRLWHLAGHAGKLAGTLAEIYADDGKSRGSQVVAARALASLGGYLQQDMSTDHCRCIPLYERSLRFDPDNPAALLGTAMVHEKSGNFVAAAKTLERLLDAHPRDEEAKLRLAINNVRSGRLRLGEAMLAELIAEGRQEWVINLAFQELARIQLDRELYDRAVKILEQATERYPESQTLTIQYALALERTREQRRAAEILAELRREEVAPGEDGFKAMTPRRRYNRWPEEVMEEIRRELRQGAESRFDVLASALASVTNGDG